MMRWIYTLLLEGNYYYVGFTENISQRLEQHFSGEGAKWTQLHKPIKVIEVVPETNNWQEDFTTLVMMRRYGIERVRGGIWCSTKPLVGIPQHYDKIDPLKTLDENLVILSKDTNKRNELPKEEDTLKFFREGKNEFQISQLMHISTLDVENHLIKLVKQGKLTAHDIGLSNFKVRQIEDAVRKINGEKNILNIKAFCDRNITVSEIRYYLALS